MTCKNSQYWLGDACIREGDREPSASSANCIGVHGVEVHEHVARISTEHEIGEALLSAKSTSVWIVWEQRFANVLVGAVCAFNFSGAARQAESRYTQLRKQGRQVRIRGRLLLLEPCPANSVPALRGVCEHVVGGVSSYRFLEGSILSEVLLSPSVGDLLIGCAVDKLMETVTLIRGNLCQHVLPFSFFTDYPSVEIPHFDDVEVIDYGQTLRLGTYEASTDSILYEIDEDYRRRANAARRDNNSSFGACLRRLRKLRRLSQSDFEPDVSAKTIARIEHGLDHAPRDRTIQIIADRLRVTPDEILTY